MKFQVINFAADNFTLAENEKGKSMQNLCEYRLFKESDPDIVISMLGGKDSTLYKNFTPDSFVDKYVKFIQEV